VTIYSPTIGQVLCETQSFAEGRYSCGGSFFTPTQSELVLTYRITGRGEPIEYSTTVPTPAGDPWADYDNDFGITLERVLHLTGQITLPSGSPVSHAKVQISGPAYLQAQADSQGHYDLYLPLPDGVTLGVLTLEATKADDRGYGTLSENLILETIGIIEKEMNLTLEPEKVSPPPADPATLPTKLVFIGQVLNGAVANFGVGNVPVKVSAPGFIEDGQCVTMTNGIYNGYFNCYTNLLKRETFTATITVENFGTTVTKQVTVTAANLPTAGTTDGLEIGKITAQPKTLHLTGQVYAVGETEVKAEVAIKVTGAKNLMLLRPKPITSVTSRRGWPCPTMPRATSPSTIMQRCQLRLA
jgi:hypothetical protein